MIPVTLRCYYNALTLHVWVQFSNEENNYRNFINYIFFYHIWVLTWVSFQTLWRTDFGVDGEFGKQGQVAVYDHSDIEKWSHYRVSRLTGAMCHTSSKAPCVLTCRLMCLLPIDQIFKLPFLFLNFRWKHFVILFPYCFDRELWEQDSILLKPGGLLTEGKI